jgi:hypothetical protein
MKTRMDAIQMLRDAVTQYERENGTLSVGVSDQGTVNTGCTAGCAGDCQGTCSGDCSGSCSYTCSGSAK